MLYADFLKTVQVFKMLYGRTVAHEFFINNMDKYPRLLEFSDAWRKRIVSGQLDHHFKD